MPPSVFHIVQISCLFSSFFFSLKEFSTGSNPFRVHFTRSIRFPGYCLIRVQCHQLSHLSLEVFFRGSHF